ncbi:MAG: hypothetical protein M1834_001011 [Cirrosporium novae-zelandiae]|nr:MAG: hypothetical protein M1834_001011 [Cirrosporium novae-zelandiae]
MSLIPPNYVPMVVTRADMDIASIGWGFTLGFGFLTAWKVIRQTRTIQSNADLNRPYVWMIWLELIDSAVFSIIVWLHLNGNIPPRVALVMINRRKAWWIKFWVAVIITAINISVYSIWIPARLQISEKFIHINDIWDRCEKCIYLIIDAALNMYFMYLVQAKLVSRGLNKYQPLVKFNIMIIGFSLAMDVSFLSSLQDTEGVELTSPQILIISTMSLANTFVYVQFHPLAYLVKLNIEMSLADLISSISRQTQSGGATSGGNTGRSHNGYFPSTELTTIKSGHDLGTSKGVHFSVNASRGYGKPFDESFSESGNGKVNVYSVDENDNLKGAVGEPDMESDFFKGRIVKTTDVVVNRESAKNSISETASISELEEEKERYADSRALNGP